MVNVSCVALLFQVQDLASHGVALPLSSVSTKASGSYTGPYSSQLTFSLNGLNWQVQVDPLSLEMVSVPVGPDALLEPVVPPQAAASRPAAPMRTPSDLRRLIVCLALHAMGGG